MISPWGMKKRSMLNMETTASSQTQESKTLKSSQAVLACPCQRPKTRIFCQNCGFVGEGRIKVPCDRHSHVIYMNDFSSCPMCMVPTSMLKEF